MKPFKSRRARTRGASAETAALPCGNCGGALAPVERAGETYPRCTRCKSWWANPRTLRRVLAHRRPTPANTRLSLVHEPNGTGHNDILLRLDHWAHRSDAYYYALAHVGGRRESPIEGVRALLNQWRADVVRCPAGAVIDLPHGFFDQSTHWLRCTCSGDAFAIVDGWSGLEGYAVDPADYADRTHPLDDFQVHEDFGAPIVLPRARLLADIDASRAALSSL